LLGKKQLVKQPKIYESEGIIPLEIKGTSDFSDFVNTTFRKLKEQEKLDPFQVAQLP